MSILLSGVGQNLFMTTTVTGPGGATLITKTPCSLSCWFKPNSNIGRQSLISIDATKTFNNNYAILYVNAGVLTSSLHNSATGTLTTIPSPLVTVGAWNHCVAVFAALGSGVIYLNGVASNLNTTNVTFPIGLNNLGIGAFYNGSTAAQFCANGQIAYPSFHKFALTQADVTALYNAGAGADPRTVEPLSLVGFPLLNGSTPYIDNITGATWSVNGAVGVGTDPFPVGIASPVVTVVGATLVTATSATLTGTIIFTRGATPTVQGFNYGLTTGYGNVVQASGSFVTGNFSLAITGLTPSTIYHFQAFSTNSVGTGFSSDVYFTTPQVGTPPGYPVPFNDRLGVSCNFDLQGAEPNWDPVVVVPLIAASGVGWVRDTVNWAQFEPTQGQYVIYSNKASWMSLIRSSGLKFCALLQYPPLFYGNTKISPNENWPIKECANFCAWLASTGLVDAIEIVNEANNVTQFAGPANGGSNANLVTLVNLTNTARAAVQMVAPNIPVIGLNEQGSEITYMLGLEPVVDGIVYHPYDPNDFIPEHTYEPPYTDYVNWVQTIQSLTDIPIWETERNCSTGTQAGEYCFAVWNARRFILSWWLGVARSFVYAFTDGSQQGLIDYWYSPRQSYFVMQRVLLALQGLNTTGQTIMVTSGSSGFNFPNIQTAVFCNQTTTVAAIWLGDSSPLTPPPSGTADITFSVLNTYVSGYIVDSVVGTYTPLSAYTTIQNGSTFTIQKFPISDAPQLITISGVAVSSPPLVSTGLAVDVGLSYASLSGYVKFNGGSMSTVTGFNYGYSASYGFNTLVNQNIDTGRFSTMITGLLPGMTYHFRAYATNASGTGVSADATFTTPRGEQAPVLAPPTAVMLGSNSATLSSEITYDGKSTSTVAGFFYGLTRAYGANVSINHPIDTGPYSVVISGLLSATYHFQAYATNATGTGVSEDATFTTISTPSSGTPTYPAVTPITPVPGGGFPLEGPDIGTSITIYETSLLDYCNPAVKNDQAFRAICLALDPELRAFLAEIQNVIILSNLSNQPEEVLDFLALYHFNVDYFDTSLPIAKKLLLVKNVIHDKISKGTPQRIIDLVNTVFSYGELIEWFNDNPVGIPNTFRILIADSLTNATTVANLYRAILTAKNVRSYFAGISSFDTAAFQNYVTMGMVQYDYQVLTIK